MTTINTTSIVKHSAVVTRDELWRNFCTNFHDIAPDLESNDAAKEFAAVHKALWSEPTTPGLLVKLFTDGMTMMLLDTATMRVFDAPDVYREIVVKFGDKNHITIPHGNIKF